MSRLGRLEAVLLVSAGALLAATGLHRWSPSPSCEVLRGSEQAFAVSGLEPRELEAGSRVRRWAGGRLKLSFVNLPATPAHLTVRVRGHRSPVHVSAAGAPVGDIQPGRSAGEYDLGLPERGRITVELASQTFAADGRSLGFQPERVSLRLGADRGAPPWSLALIVLLPALVTLASGLAARLAPVHAALVAILLAALQTLLLVPQGMARSPWAAELALLLALSSLAAAAFAAAQARVATSAGRDGPGAARWAFGAMLGAAFVQGVLATHPGMVVSDALFHANNLLKVSWGDWLLTSATPHVPPFRIPYGVSFYALLLPLVGTGLDLVLLVRAGAALAGVASSAALFSVLARGGAARAGVAVLLLQLLPMTFDIFSYGNLSNVCGQAVTVFFFCWWAAGAPGRWPLGALLLALAGAAHLGSLIVLLALLPAWAIADRERLRRDPRPLLAIGLGLGLLVLYYSAFARLVSAQLPRLLEGAGRGEPLGPLPAAFRQLRAALEQWGAPAAVLALLGWLGGAHGNFPRPLLGFWWAGIGLAALATVSPVEVRYAYALGPALAVAAADGLGFLFRRSWGRAFGSLLVAAQAALAGREMVEGVLYRYRP